MILKKFFLPFLVLLFLISTSYSTKVELEIDEVATLAKLPNGQYSLTAEGEIEVYNPSNVSKVYELYFPLELDSLIGINKLDLDNSSSKFTFTYNSIKGYLIGPNERARVGYSIFGLLDYDIFKKVDDTSILQYYVKDFDLVSKVVLNLNKPLREGYIRDITGNLTDTPEEETTNRLISAQIRNPTDFNYNIRELRLYRTQVGDPMFKDGKIVKIYNNLTINPFDYTEVNFFDAMNTENIVYWLSTDLYIDYLLNISSIKTYVSQPTTPTSPSNPGGGSSGGSGGGGFTPNDILDSIIVKKETDKTMIQSGDELEVTLRIVNVNDFELVNLTLYDIAPDGYEIKEVSNNVRISEGNLIFDIDKIGNYENYVITYTLIPKSKFKGITYLKPAKLDYLNNTYYSQGVLIVNDLLPEEKVFVQKEIKYIDDDYAEIKIKVRNLGNYVLEDILISDDLSESSIIKDISKVFFDRGVWRIKLLNPGEEWEVTYMVSRGGKLDSLPNVFGVEKSEVYGTLVFSEEVITLFKEEPRIIEKVGMSLAVGFLIIYLLF